MISRSHPRLFLKFMFVVGFMLTHQLSSVNAQTLSEKLLAEDAARLAQEAHESGSAVNGAILFSQQKLGCVNCHASGNSNLLGPDLTRLDQATTDQALVDALLDPSKTIREGYSTVTIQTVDGNTVAGRVLEQTDESITLRQVAPPYSQTTLPTDQIDELQNDTVSAMPQGLVDQLSNRQQFLDLVRYLIELRDHQTAEVSRVVNSLGGGVIDSQLQGLALLDQLNCRACHSIDSWDQAVTNRIPAYQAPRLNESSRGIDPDFLGEFIANPSHMKPGTSMPNVLGHLPIEQQKSIAEDLTEFLVSLAETKFSREPVDAEQAAHGETLFHSIGCVACHSPRDSSGNETLAGDSVPLGDLSRKYSVASLSAFLETPHQFRPSGRMPDLQLDHFEAIDLASYLVGTQPIESTARVADPMAANRGASHFQELRCASCHAYDAEKLAISSDAISKMIEIQQPTAGCLSGEVGAWPNFSLTDDQRELLSNTLTASYEPLSSQQTVDLSMSLFRCVNCHQRGELGGVSLARDPFFQTTDPNLGPQGRIPPSLTGVGAKLNPEWLRQVLVSGRSIRPYLLTRMPKFGTSNVEPLLELLPAADMQNHKEFPPTADADLARKAGHELVGNQGFNCVACHTFQLQKAETMSAVDLTEMAERLQRDWFESYMQAPQQFNPNTVMPSFWPGGRSIRPELLEGETEKQLEALWEYLAEGRQAREPRGLRSEPLELLAGDTAVMLRRSYPGVGKRGIGVGYPGDINLVFDAEQMRVAMIWRGKFADPSGVWRSQGHGNVRPLGREVLNFPAGPDLDFTEHPWIVGEDRPSHHQFKGYRLDEQRRPQFRYLVDSVQVEDALRESEDENSEFARLKRTLILTSDQPRNDLSLRLGAGQRIEALDDGSYLIDGRLTVRIAESLPAEIVPQGEESLLRLPLALESRETSVEITYEWK